ncbi:MAG: hypothetical protein IKA72_02820 [Clostridia bacterium]|nr:hypothetical protein [Clostridia bacterium]
MEEIKNEKNMEEFFLEKIIETESLLVEKTKIHARLLTEIRLAKEMEEIASRRQKSKTEWLEIFTGKPQKSENDEDEQEQGESER